MLERSFSQAGLIIKEADSPFGGQRNAYFWSRYTRRPFSRVEA